MARGHPWPVSVECARARHRGHALRSLPGALRARTGPHRRGRVHPVPGRPAAWLPRHPVRGDRRPRPALERARAERVHRHRLREESDRGDRRGDRGAAMAERLRAVEVFDGADMSNTCPRLAVIRAPWSTSAVVTKSTVNFTAANTSAQKVANATHRINHARRSARTAARARLRCWRWIARGTPPECDAGSTCRTPGTLGSPAAGSRRRPG